MAECRMYRKKTNFSLSEPLSPDSNSPAWRTRESRFTASGIWMPALIASAPKMWMFAQIAARAKSAFGCPTRRTLPASHAGVYGAELPTRHLAGASGNSQRDHYSTIPCYGFGSRMPALAIGIGPQPETCAAQSSSLPYGLLTRGSNNRARRRSRCLC